MKSLIILSFLEKYAFVNKIYFDFNARIYKIISNNYTLEFVNRSSIKISLCGTHTALPYPDLNGRNIFI